ncbi:MAG: hypothetical protein JSU86_13840, partial [Phycisphaerales bacterium]
ADGASVTLTLQDATNVASGVNAQAVVRVFTGNLPDSGTQVILGGGSTGPTVFPLPEDDPSHDVDLAALRAADVSLWVEGLEFAGEVKLEMEVNDGTGSTCSDQIQLKVAPFIMLPNTATASRVLVADNDPDFHDAIEGLAGPGNVITTTAGDRWTQDAWEFGFSSRPVGGQQARMMPQGFETLREGRALQDWGRVHLLGPAAVGTDRMGLIERLAETDDPLGHGGNLELLPAYDGYPLGRIVVGTMPQLQKNFLTRQGVQAPLVELDTSWLYVGHIDELLAIIPPSSDEPWDIVWASPQRAFEALMAVGPHEPLFYRHSDGGVFSGQASGGTEDTLEDDDVDFIGEPFFAYVRIYDGTGKGQVAELDPTATTHTTVKVKNVWVFNEMLDYSRAVRHGTGASPLSIWYTTPDSTSKYVLVPWSKMWEWTDDSIQPPIVRQFPAVVTAHEILNDSLYAEHNVAPSQSAIDTAKDSITSALPLLHPMAFIDVPALYTGDARDGSRWAFAWTPGIPNMQVWNDVLSTSLWIPKPFGPRLTVGSLRIDTFEAAVDEALSSGRFLHYIDDWNEYHRWKGEIHCGTNVIRTPPGTLKRWWEDSTN